MAEGKFAAYYRVSTDRQGHSGLGLEAQREAVNRYLNGGNWELIAAFQETESGKDNDRPELQRALQLCKVTGATLLIAKLDRLSRNAAFILQLQDAGVRFTAVDNPQVNDTVVGILAVIAQDERKRISERTKQALQAAKARGQTLGNGGKTAHHLVPGNPKAVHAVQENASERAEALRPIVAEVLAGGYSTTRQVAAELNRRGILTARGGQWHAASVKRLRERLGM